MIDLVIQRKMTNLFSSICCKGPSDVTKLIVISASVVFISILFKLVADFFGQRFRNINFYYYVVSGLTAAEIAQLPMTRYQTNLASGTSECAICISELECDTLVRILPNCKHLFHQECIDRWFRISGTCPVCRTIASAGESIISSLLLPDTTSSGATSAAMLEMTSTSASVLPSAFASPSTSPHSVVDNMV